MGEIGVDVRLLAVVPAALQIEGAHTGGPDLSHVRAQEMPDPRLRVGAADGDALEPLQQRAQVAHRVPGAGTDEGVLHGLVAPLPVLASLPLPATRGSRVAAELCVACVLAVPVAAGLWVGAAADRASLRMLLRL